MTQEVHRARGMHIEQAGQLAQLYTQTQTDAFTRDWLRFDVSVVVVVCDSRWTSGGRFEVRRWRATDNEPIPATLRWGNPGHLGRSGLGRELYWSDAKHKPRLEPH